MISLVTLIQVFLISTERHLTIADALKRYNKDDRVEYLYVKKSFLKM